LEDTLRALAMVPVPEGHYAGIYYVESPEILRRINEDGEMVGAKIMFMGEIPGYIKVAFPYAIKMPPR